MKIKFTLSLFYIGNNLYINNYKILYLLVKVFYKLIVEYILNIELPLNIKVGKNLHIEHG